MVADTSGFALSRHNVFFSEDYAAEFTDIFLRDRLPVRPTVYVCAQDRDDEGAKGEDGAERLLLLVNAPPTGDIHPFQHAEIEKCRQRAFGLLEKCGLSVDYNSANALCDDAGGLRPSLSRVGRSALWPGDARLERLVHAPDGAHADPWLVSGGGQRASRGRGANGGSVGAPRGCARCCRTWLRRASRNGGYAWWYIDAVSDDGRDAIAIIAFLGSVFSPYYACIPALGAGRSTQSLCAQRGALPPRGKALGADGADTS